MTALKCWDDFLAALGAADANEVASAVTWHVDFDVDDAWCVVSGDAHEDEVQVELGSGTFSIGDSLSFPFSLRTWWRTIDALDRAAAGLLDALRLPAVAPDSAPNALIDHLAAQFGWVDEELFDVIGGGWRTCDDEVLRAEEDPQSVLRAVDREAIAPTDQRSWICAGDPALVVLGIGRTSTIIARPTVVPSGYRGPEHFALSGLHLIQTEDLVDLASGAAELIGRTVSQSRRLLKLCHGCRRFLPLEFELSGGSKVCRGCAETFGSVLID